MFKLQVWYYSWLRFINSLSVPCSRTATASKIFTFVEARSISNGKSYLTAFHKKILWKLKKFIIVKSVIKSPQQHLLYETHDDVQSIYHK